MVRRARVVLYITGSVGQVAVCDVRAHQAARFTDLNGCCVAATQVQLDDNNICVLR